jgi:hypothetical protein
MKILIFIGLVALTTSVHAKTSEVMGMIARCSCTESTVDGDRNLGRFTSAKSFKSDQAARNSIYAQCSKKADGAVSVSDCQYIKVVDQKNGKKIKRHVVNIKDDEENSLHNDLISTL